MSRLFCLLVVVASLLPGQEPTVSDATASFEMDVLCFNVRYGTAKDGENAWPRRQHVVMQVLTEKPWAIIGVQEALAFQVDAMAKALPHHRVIGQGRLGGRENEFAALYVDRRIFDVLESGDFWLSEKPSAVGSKGWDAALPRICTWARLAHRASGRHIAVFNAHFDHRGRRARLESARLVARRSKELAKGAPRIVMGDFNAGEASEPLKALRGAGLRDSFRDRNPRAEKVGTFGAWRGKTDGQKIDHLLIEKPWETVAAGIDSRAREGRWPSDHHPVHARLRLPAPGPKKDH